MNQREHTVYRGLVLRESLVASELPQSLLQFVETEYAYFLDGERPVTVIRLQIPAPDLVPAAWEMALALIPQHYFANFIGTDDMLVAFPGALVRVLCNTPSTAELARSMGHQFSIPNQQMRFEAMFEHDHPHTPKGQPSLSAGQ